VDTIADLQGFPAVLGKAGYREEVVEGILSGNALRLFREAWR
jgi:microsomal dipeptidase-like Zn-dependent dipeptidase